MKAILLLVVFFSAVYKRFIQSEERVYDLKVSSIPVNNHLKRKQLILACKNVQMTKATKKRKK